MSNAFDKTIDSALPIVAINGLITHNNVDMSDSSTVLLPAGTTIGGSSLTALGTITSSSAQALAVGLNGLTNPAFNVDSSTGSQADGVNVKGLAAGNGAQVSVITSGTNAPLTINAAGSGTITIGGVSTGAITLTRATTFTNGVTIGASKSIASAGTGATGTVLADLKNAAAGTLSGTALNVEISIGGVPYYFAVYPTKT